MLFGLNLFALPELVTLPQNDSDQESRASEIKEIGHEYEWDHSMICDSPMLARVPQDESPAVGWMEGMLKNLFRVTLNSLAVRFHDSQEQFFEEKKILLSTITSFSARILKALTLGTFSLTEINNIAGEVGALLGGDIEGSGLVLQDYKTLFRVF